MDPSRAPGGAIAVVPQHRHQRIQMFEGYVGTSDSGFRNEAQAEEALACGRYLGGTYADSERLRLTGSAGAEAEMWLAAFARHTIFDGQVVTDEAGPRQIMTCHAPSRPGHLPRCLHHLRPHP